MNMLGKTALGLSITVATAFGAHAQDDSQYVLNGNAKTETVTNTVLQAPVVKENYNSGKAQRASFDGNIAVHIFQSKHDSISGHSYAKTFANGFASCEYTHNKPIYITATYRDGGTTNKETYVNIFIDGNITVQPNFPRYWQVNYYQRS